MCILHRYEYILPSYNGANGIRLDVVGPRGSTMSNELFLIVNQTSIPPLSPLGQS